MAYQRLQKSSSWSPKIPTNVSRFDASPITVQRQPASTTTQEQDELAYTALPSDWISNNSLFRGLSEAESVPTQEGQQINASIAQMDGEQAVQRQAMLNEDEVMMKPESGIIQRQTEVIQKADDEASWEKALIKTDRSNPILAIGQQRGSQQPLPQQPGWQQTSPSDKKDSESKRSMLRMGQRFNPKPLPNQYKDEEKKAGWRAQHFWQAGGDPESTNITTKYYSPEERKQSHVHLDSEGRLITHGGEELDTRDKKAQLHAKRKNYPEVGFVMGLDGEFYTFDGGVPKQKDDGTWEGINHSSPLAGADVAGAGTLVAQQGFIREITDSSGHYQPTAEHTYQTVKSLHDRGAEMAPLVQDLTNPEEVEQGAEPVMDIGPSSAIVTLTNKPGMPGNISLRYQQFLQSEGNEQQIRNKARLNQSIETFDRNQLQHTPTRVSNPLDEFKTEQFLQNVDSFPIPVPDFDLEQEKRIESEQFTTDPKEVQSRMQAKNPLIEGEELLNAEKYGQAANYFYKLAQAPNSNYWEECMNQLIEVMHKIVWQTSNSGNLKSDEITQILRFIGDNYYQKLDENGGLAQKVRLMAGEYEVKIPN